MRRSIAVLVLLSVVACGDDSAPTRSRSSPSKPVPPAPVADRGAASTEASRAVDVIEALPAPDELRRVTQSLAALDAIVCPEAESRYYAFDAAWGEGESMASMRNGSGDHWFALFTEHGVALHGLAHEAATFEPGTPAPWVFGELPECFRGCFLDEPAFDTANSTWCLWRQTGDARWRRGPRPDGVHDGQAEQLSVLLGGAPAYVAWARDVYELDLDAEAVAAVFRHEAITPALARRLRPAVDHEQVERELRTIGYGTPR